MTMPSLIVRNARALTMDPARPRASALAVAGNRIVAVGDDAEIAALAGPATRIVDAGGASLLPGFIESHMHLFSGAAHLDTLDLGAVMDPDAFVATVRAYAARRPGDRLLFARQANYSMLGRPITRHDLDAASPERPFAMLAPDSHTAWANTRALELAGLLHGRVVNPGSEIVIGADGLATGELREADAFGPVLALTPSGGRDSLGYTTGRDPDPAPTAAERTGDIATLRRGLDYCASLGITTVHNMDGNFYQLELLADIAAADGLKARVQVPFHMKNDKPLADLAEAVEMRRRYPGPQLYSGRVKVFMDGVLDSGTAFVLGGYPDDPGSVGDPLFDAETFNAIAVEADRAGLQISVHAIGDAAVRRTLDGYAAARAANGARDSRHRVEHIEIVDPADIPRFAELGVIASMQPLHAVGSGGFPEEPTRSKIGACKLPLAYAWRTLRQAGAAVAFSSDWPVSPLEPLKSVKAATTRARLDPAYPDQRQSLHEVLHGYTAGGAWCDFSETSKGRLAEGFLADLVLLDGDLEATDPHAVDRLAARLTVCDGRITYEA